HNPVMPAGPRKRNAHSSEVSSCASYSGKGRLPTNDMSPFRTLKSWGSSSKLVLRKKEPNFVTLGSSFILTKAEVPPFTAYWFIADSPASSLSAFSRIDRNL